MKKLLLLLISCLSLFYKVKGQTYPSLNVTLLSHIDPETDLTGNDNRKYSGCWGWYQASTNREYAIVGTSSKTYFIDVTNPHSPVLADSVMAVRKGCTWREIKTYQNYCYIVSDDAAPNTFQIVDMQYLPDSVHVVYNDSTLFERSHTIFVDNGHLYCGGPTPTGVGSTDNMRIYSLANPELPVLLRKLSQDVPSITYVHDMFVRNDTVYASCGGQGLYIIKYNSALNTFSLMQSYSNYPFNGYNHSSWQTDNRKTMVFADEVPAGLPAKVIDVSDFNNITLVDTIISHTGATPHNPYIVNNNWCWVSSYQDGLYLYNISNPSRTVIHGYFDTQPQHGVNDNFSTNAYRGNWGAYPFLPSKIIIACDMQNGIFILDGDYDYKITVGIKDLTPKQASSFWVYPNPASNELNLVIANQNNATVNYMITDITGKTILENKLKITDFLFKTTVSITDLKPGCYFITLKGNTLNETKKILIQN